MKDIIKHQTAGDQSTNVQAERVEIHHHGLSLRDVKEVVSDIFKENFPRLKEEAAKIAQIRAEELFDSLASKLQNERRTSFDSFSQPGMQIALYKAQYEYAKTGDKDLEELLVDILADRSSINARNLRQIVLDEALVIAPKLTVDQLDALTLNFLILRTANANVNSIDTFISYLKSHFGPFVTSFRPNSSCYEHLEYSGCGSIMAIGERGSLEKIFLAKHPGIFRSGFTEDDVKPPLDLLKLLQNQLIIRCLHEKTKLQVNAMNTEVIRKILQCDIDTKNALVNLFESYGMTPEEVRKFIASAYPEFGVLFELWSNSPLSKLTLTTVGIAIAQANFRRRTGIHFDLSTWIK